MARVLHLTLKKKWFDMIASGEKKEEYREIKTYWKRRLMNVHTFKQWDAICFHHGYAKDHAKMIFDYRYTTLGTAKPEWSDNWQGEVYVIGIGNKITGDTCHKCGELTGTTKCNSNHL